MSTAQAGKDHRELHGPEQDEGTGTCIELHVGEGKRRRVGEQVEATNPRARATIRRRGFRRDACTRRTAQGNDHEQDHAPRRQPQEREGGRIDPIPGQGQSAEDGIRREGEHGNDRQYQRRHAHDGIC